MAIFPTDNLRIERGGEHYKAPVSQLPSGGGGGGGLSGLATVTIAVNSTEWTETVAAVGVTPSSRIMLGIAPANDDDENDPLWLSALQMVASAGTDEITISMAFATEERGPIKLIWSAL